jgi:hypothetical protein
MAYNVAASARIKNRDVIQLDSIKIKLLLYVSFKKLNKTNSKHKIEFKFVLFFFF